MRVSTLGEGLEIQNFHQSEKGFCFLYGTKSCLVGCGVLRKDPGFERPSSRFSFVTLLFMSLFMTELLRGQQAEKLPSQGCNITNVQEKYRF